MAVLSIELNSQSFDQDLKKTLTGAKTAVKDFKRDVQKMLKDQLVKLPGEIVLKAFKTNMDTIQAQLRQSTPLQIKSQLKFHYLAQNLKALQAEINKHAPLYIRVVAQPMTQASTAMATGSVFGATLQKDMDQAVKSIKIPTQAVYRKYWELREAESKIISATNAKFKAQRAGQVYDNPIFSDANILNAQKQLGKLRKVYADLDNVMRLDSLARGQYSLDHAAANQLNKELKKVKPVFQDIQKNVQEIVSIPAVTVPAISSVATTQKQLQRHATDYKALSETVLIAQRSLKSVEDNFKKMPISEYKSAYLLAESQLNAAKQAVADYDKGLSQNNSMMSQIVGKLKKNKGFEKVGKTLGIAALVSMSAGIAQASTGFDMSGSFADLLSNAAIPGAIVAKPVIEKMRSWYKSIRDIFTDDYGQGITSNFGANVASNVTQAQAAVTNAIQQTTAERYRELAVKKESWDLTAKEYKEFKQIEEGYKTSLRGKRELATLQNDLAQDSAMHAQAEINRQNKINGLMERANRTQRELLDMRSSVSPNSSYYQIWTRDINKTQDAMERFSSGKVVNMGGFLKADEELGRFETRLKRFHGDFPAIMKSMEKPTMSLAQKFELFGMTMSGFAATIFVFQYAFMAFKGLIDVNNKLNDSVERLNLKYKFTVQQQKLLYDVARDTAKATSMSSEEVLKYLDREMKKRQEIGEDVSMKKSLGMAVAKLYKERLDYETQSLGNALKEMSNQFVEIIMSIFDKYDAPLKKMLSGIVEYFKANRTAIIEFGASIVDSAGAMFKALSPIGGLLSSLIGGFSSLASVGGGTAGGIIGAGAIYGLAGWYGGSKVGFDLKEIQKSATVASAEYMKSWQQGIFAKSSLISNAMGQALASTWGVAKAAGTAVATAFTGAIGFIIRSTLYGLIAWAVFAVLDKLIDAAKVVYNKVVNPTEIEKFEKQKEVLERALKTAQIVNTPENQTAITQLQKDLEKVNQIIDDLKSSVNKQKKEVTATMISVIDGDTITAKVGENFEKIRMAYINSAESVHKDLSQNAVVGKFQSLILDSILNTGDEIDLKIKDEVRDFYGRLLAEIEKGGFNVNEMMLAAGAQYVGKYGEKEKYKNVKVDPNVLKIFDDMKKHAEELGITLDTVTMKWSSIGQFMNTYAVQAGVALQLNLINKELENLRGNSGMYELGENVTKRTAELTQMKEELQKIGKLAKDMSASGWFDTQEFKDMVELDAIMNRLKKEMPIEKFAISIGFNIESTQDYANLEAKWYAKLKEMAQKAQTFGKNAVTSNAQLVTAIAKSNVAQARDEIDKLINSLDFKEQLMRFDADIKNALKLDNRSLAEDLQQQRSDLVDEQYGEIELKYRVVLNADMDAAKAELQSSTDMQNIKKLLESVYWGVDWEKELNLDTPMDKAKEALQKINPEMVKVLNNVKALYVQKTNEAAIAINKELGKIKIGLVGGEIKTNIEMEKNLIDSLSNMEKQYESFSNELNKVDTNTYDARRMKLHTWEQEYIASIQKYVDAYGEASFSTKFGFTSDAAIARIEALSFMYGSQLGTLSDLEIIKQNIDNISKAENITEGQKLEYYRAQLAVLNQMQNTDFPDPRGESYSNKAISGLSTDTSGKYKASLEKIKSEGTTIIRQLYEDLDKIGIASYEYQSKITAMEFADKRAKLEEYLDEVVKAKADEKAIILKQFDEIRKYQDRELLKTVLEYEGFYGGVKAGLMDWQDDWITSQKEMGAASRKFIADVRQELKDFFAESIKMSIKTLFNEDSFQDLSDDFDRVEAELEASANARTTLIFTPEMEEAFARMNQVQVDSSSDAYASQVNAAIEYYTEVERLATTEQDRMAAAYQAQYYEIEKQRLQDIADAGGDAAKIAEINEEANKEILDAKKDFVDEWYEYQLDTITEMNEKTQDTYKNLFDAIGGFFKDMIDSIWEMFLELIAKMIAQDIFNWLFSSSGNGVSFNVGGSSGSGAGMTTTISALTAIAQYGKTAYGWVTSLGAATSQLGTVAGSTAPAVAGASGAMELYGTEASIASAKVIAAEEATAEATTAASSSTLSSLASVVSYIGILYTLFSTDWDKVFSGPGTSTLQILAEYEAGIRSLTETEAAYYKQNYLGMEQLVDVNRYSSQAMQDYWKDATANHETFTTLTLSQMDAIKAKALELEMAISQETGALNDMGVTLINTTSDEIRVELEKLMAEFQIDPSDEWYDLIIQVDAPSSIPVSYGDLTQGMAAGGPVSANTPYIIGEVGPELFVPQSSGNILSNKDMRSLMGMGIKGYASGTATLPGYNVTPYSNGTTDLNMWSEHSDNIEHLDKTMQDFQGVIQDAIDTKEIILPWESDPATHSSGTTEQDMWTDLYKQTRDYLDLLTDLQSELKAINEYYEEQITLAQELGVTEEELNDIYAMQEAAVAALTLEFVTSYNEYVNEALGLTSDLGNELNDLNQYYIEAIQNAHALGASNLQLIKMLKDWKDIQAELIAQFEDDYQDYVNEMLGLSSDLGNSIDELAEYYEEAIQSATDAGYTQEQLNQMLADQAAIQAELIAQFENDYQDYVNEALGLNTDLGNSLDDLADYYESAIQSAIDAGYTTEQLTQMYEDWANIAAQLTQDLVDDVLQQSADLAERTSGLTIDEQLFNDIEDLNEKFLELYNTLNDEGLDTSQLFIDYAQAVSNLMQDIADSILGQLDDVNDQIERYNWDIANPGGTTSQYLAQQIGSLYATMMSNPEQMTLENINSTAGMLVEWYAAAVSEAEAQAQAMADAVNDEIQARESAISSIKSFVSSIDDAIQSIKYSALNVALPSQKAAAAQSDYAFLKTKAFSSTATMDDLEAFKDFSTTYLQQSQDAYKSSTKYQGIYSTVMGDLAALKIKAQSTSFEQQMVNELMQVNNNLAKMEDYLDLSAINSAFTSAQSEIARLITEFTNGSMIVEGDVTVQFSIDMADAVTAAIMDWISERLAVTGKIYTSLVLATDATTNAIMDWLNYRLTVAGKIYTYLVIGSDPTTNAIMDWLNDRLTIAGKIYTYLVIGSDPTTNAIMDWLNDRLMVAGKIYTSLVLATDPTTNAIMDWLNYRLTVAGKIYTSLVLATDPTTNAIMDWLNDRLTVAGKIYTYLVIGSDPTTNAIMDWISERLAVTGKIYTSLVLATDETTNAIMDWITQAILVPATITASISLDTADDLTKIILDWVTGDILIQPVLTATLTLDTNDETTMAILTWLSDPSLGSSIKNIQTVVSDPAGYHALSQNQYENVSPGQDSGYYNTESGALYNIFAFAGKSPGEMLFDIAYNTFQIAGALDKPGFFAEGGIISSPTLGMIGEAGYPEAVIPMKSGYVPVQFTGQSTGSSGMSDPEIKPLLKEIVAAIREGKIIQIDGKPIAQIADRVTTDKYNRNQMSRRVF